MKLFLIISLIFLGGQVHAQQKNARSVEFSNLRLSPDSTALIFNAAYFEEGKPQSTPVLLVKKLTTGELACFNPQPQRFAISGNEKYLIFSALFGIFFQELADSGYCRQLTFRDPASDEYLRDLGFFAADSGVFWTTENYKSESLAKKFWRMQPDSLGERGAIQLLEIPAPGKWKKSSLPVADPNSGRQREFKLAKRKLRFFITPRTGTEFDLSDISFQQSASGKKKTVLSKIRPWLISVSPTQKWIIFSIWQKTPGESSWLNLAGTDSLTEIGAGAFKFVSWVDSSRFVGLNNAGLFHYSTDSLAAKAIQPRCQLAWPLALQDTTAAGKNELIVGGQLFKIENAPGAFKRSRIRVTNQTTGATEILVTEMSNLDQKW